VTTTITSAGLGAGSHVLIDGFTHSGRWGAAWLDLDRVVAELPVRGEITVARVLQYLGHTGGSLLGIAFLIRIGSGRLVEQWYSREAVAEARSNEPTLRQRIAFWNLAVVPPILVLGLGPGSKTSVFGALTAAAVAVLLAGVVVRPPAQQEREPSLP
jgi:hypothetical protein